MEALANIHTVLLDKTGTLTYGSPEVVGVHPVEGTAGNSLLEAAWTAEVRSETSRSKGDIAEGRNHGCLRKRARSF